MDGGGCQSIEARPQEIGQVPKLSCSTVVGYWGWMKALQNWGESGLVVVGVGDTRRWELPVAGQDKGRSWCLACSWR